MSRRSALGLVVLFLLGRGSVAGSGVPVSEYRSAHILLSAPRGAGVDAVLGALERGYDEVRKYGLDLPPRISAVSYGSTAEFVRGSRGSAYHLAVAREGVIHLQPASLLLRRADLARAVRHELVHVSLMAGASRLPLWLNEGLAMNVAGEKLPVAGSFRSLAELEDALGQAASYAQARRSYGRAERLVSALIASTGREKVVALVKAVAGGEAFEGAFARIVGTTPDVWGARALRR